MKLIIFNFGALLFAIQSFGQSPLLPNGSLTEYMIKRYEIKSGTVLNDIHTDIAPFYREHAGTFLQSAWQNQPSLSKVDSSLFIYHQEDNLNWADGKWDNHKPILKALYHQRNSIYSVHEDGFELFVNPVIYYTMGTESNYPDSQAIFKNERGAEVRGNIGKKIGFYTYFTDNQARYPVYVNNWINTKGSVPGEGFWKPFKGTGVDHYTARGHITWSALKYVDFTFGHGRNFIGNGMRSLLLSDFGRDYLHLRVNTKIWRFNYQNIFAEMMNVQNFTNLGNRFSVGQYPRKYMAAHYLSLDVTPKLSVGLFEAEIFHDGDSLGRGFDFNYLNPIIFYRAVEHYLGSADNAMMALNVNYLPIKGLSVYGQFIIDEFKFDELVHNPGWWANKYGVQAGLRAIDVFGINNLDYQFEFNTVRPYTYQHLSGGTNYVHYNQPMAHPYGANFKEAINRIKWMPIKNVFVDAIYNYSIIGLDSNGSNWGNDLLLNMYTHQQENGNRTGQGVRAVMNRFDLNISYAIRHNIFFDVSFTHRSFVTATGDGSRTSNMFNAGIRWNAIPKNLYF